MGDKINVKLDIIEHSKRAEFWVKYPKAEEISKEKYDAIKELIQNDDEVDSIGNS